MHTFLCQRCDHAARTKPREPKTALGWFVLDRWQKSGLTLKGYAGELKLHPATLRHVLDGRLPTRKTVKILQATYGGDLPPFDRAGTQVREKYRERVKQAATDRDKKAISRIYAQMHTKKARNKAAATKKGRPLAPDVLKERLVRLKSDSALLENFISAGRKEANSLKGKARRSLVFSLTRRPNPSETQLDQLAVRVAQRLGTSKKQVQRYWQPTLIKRGLKHPGGRPANYEHRRHIFAELLQERPPAPSGRLPNGWMEEFENRVAGTEHEAPAYGALRLWLYREGLLPVKGV